MKTIKKLISKYFDLSYKARTLITSKGSIIYNATSAIVRLVLGYVFKSIFFVIGGTYSAGLAIIRIIYLRSDKVSPEEERKYFLMMNITLFITTLFYIGNTIKYFITPDVYNYQLLIGIAIAIFGFVDLTIAIIGLMRTNKENDLMFTGIKLVSLTSAFTSLALTQAALLSSDGFLNNIDNSFYIGVGGLFFGGLNIIICIIMFVIYLKSRSKHKELTKTTL